LGSVRDKGGQDEKEMAEIRGFEGEGQGSGFSRKQGSRLRTRLLA
jgi:hypothetical protein